MFRSPVQGREARIAGPGILGGCRHSQTRVLDGVYYTAHAWARIARAPCSLRSALCTLLTAHRDIPTIVITGKEEPGTAERVRASGAVGFLTKPFDESDLLTVVRRSLTSPDSA